MITATRTEYSPAKPTMMAPSKCRELAATLETLPAVSVWHPMVFVHVAHVGLTRRGWIRVG